MASHSYHNWRINNWEIADQTVTLIWRCSRRGCPWFTATTKTFRKPAGATRMTYVPLRMPGT